MPRVACIFLDSGAFTSATGEPDFSFLVASDYSLHYLFARYLYFLYSGNLGTSQCLLLPHLLNLLHLVLGESSLLKNIIPLLEMILLYTGGGCARAHCVLLFVPR